LSDEKEDAPAAEELSAHRLLGLTDEEHDHIVRILRREPRPAELAMFSVMWSEHCSYKSSRRHLRRLPTAGPHVVVGPGQNAGVVEVGDGWLAALRIESHNHPSLVEPYQGAATGVGGIVRDVFTMGARPIALWDSLRFGPLDRARNRYLLKGVVSGVAGYGNAVGVPTVGGELAFEDCYSGNPLVNVMCLGILRPDQLVLATAGRPGNVAVLLGAATGRDGIGGASVLASASFDVETEAKRPSVQVGDPFEEKKLIEACLEMYEQGLVAGVQDLGAAGLSCALTEPVSRAGLGIEVNLDAVSRREPDMSADELLMSESQERMMAFVEPAHLDEVMAVAKRWEIDAAVVGTVREGGNVSVYSGGELVAEVPAGALAGGAPILDRPYGEPGWMEDLWSHTISFMQEPALANSLLALLDDPAIASKAAIYEQYDHMLFLNTVVGPGHDATLLRLKGTRRALAVSTDGNGRLCYLDPRRGAARIVYEAALNVAVVGARPLALVDNLNFGNPEKTEVMWQFVETVEGIAEACRALDIPVVGGNVSFYNETDGLDIYPTPVVGLLGIVDELNFTPPRLDRAEAGMDVWRFGPTWAINLAGSAFEKVTFAHVGGRPSAPDPTSARLAIETARRLAAGDLASVLHDISEGGLAMAVAEICIASGVGARLYFDDWRHLFCEDPHRFVAAALAQNRQRVTEVADQLGITAEPIGSFGGGEISFERAGMRTSLDLAVATEANRRALPRRLV